MRRMKLTEGLNLRRSRSETQRWHGFFPNLESEINAMQELTGVNYETSAKHKDFQCV